VTGAAADWPCEAYGMAGLEHGARCFFADLDDRTCIDPLVCHLALYAERRRVFRVIHERAAAGDPVAQMLAADFTSPDQLLGGSGD
jgi:hypothetical protein